MRREKKPAKAAKPTIEPAHDNETLADSELEAATGGGMISSAIKNLGEGLKSVGRKD